MKFLFLIATFGFMAFGLTAPVAASPSPSALETPEMARQHDVEKRKKARIKGGSGCDDAHDILEYPACR